MTSRLVEWVVIVFVFLLLARNSSCGGRTRVAAAGGVVAAGDGRTRVASTVVDTDASAGACAVVVDADRCCRRWL